MHPATTRGRAVPSSHRRLRAAAILVLLAALTGAVLAVPIAAATSSVTGSITYRERIALTPQAVAIITIVDTTAAPDAGAVIGQQRIDAPTARPHRLLGPRRCEHDRPDPRLRPVRDHRRRRRAPGRTRSASRSSPAARPAGSPLTLASVPATPAATITGTIVPPAATAHRTGRRLDRRAHQGRDRDARRAPGAADHGSREPRLLDRIRPEPHRSGRDVRRQGRDRRRGVGLAEPGGGQRHLGRQGVRHA